MQHQKISVLTIGHTAQLCTTTHVLQVLAKINAMQRHVPEYSIPSLESGLIKANTGLLKDGPNGIVSKTLSSIA